MGFCLYVALFPYEKMGKANFDQQTRCKALIRWSKYTTWRLSILLQLAWTQTNPIVDTLDKYEWDLKNGKYLKGYITSDNLWFWKGYLIPFKRFFHLSGLKL